MALSLNYIILLTLEYTLCFVNRHISSLYFS